jgi:predicted transcriptional regulator
MLKDLDCLKGKEYTNQKISAIMSNLVKEGSVERVMDKRKSYFRKVIGE